MADDERAQKLIQPTRDDINNFRMEFERNEKVFPLISPNLFVVLPLIYLFQFMGILSWSCSSLFRE